MNPNDWPILEGIVTTRHADGSMHLAPMGPRVHPTVTRLLLRPFPSSTTYRNLRAHGQGVFHITDDVLLLAKAAVGGLREFPAWHRAEQIDGFILDDACRAHEFVIRSIDDSRERVHIDAEVVRSVTQRDFFGFNRAKHAVLEAAILATRFHLLDLTEVRGEYDRLRVLVEKTGGPAEHEAFAFLQERLAQQEPR